MKKNRISKNWINKQRRDIYVRKSKIEGYRSRAIYKLKEIDEIFIRKIEFVMPTITFSVSSDSDLNYLKQEIDRIEDELKSVDGISEISITGLPEKEIEIS